MTQQDELREALEYIPPAELNYQEWITVGMGLREAGCPLSLWEEWSRQDSARFHFGECAAKWESFKGSSSPVTAASIFEMAYSHGYGGPSYALEWDAEICAKPGWVEEQDIEIPVEWNPTEQLIRYLQALFEPTENVGYCTESFLRDGKWMPTKGSYDRTAGQLIEALNGCKGDIGSVLGDYHEEAGAWIRFNPLDGQGAKNTNVTEFRFALVECDQLELGRQLGLIHSLELPCAAVVYSGGKSVHAIVHIDAATYPEYRTRVEYLYSVCKKHGLPLDEQNKNPSRLSRMPGVLRNGVKQFLIETGTGKANYAEWKDWVEASTDDLPEFESMADLWADPPDLAPALIEGVLRQGHKMLLAGPSKSGKSFALIELCIAIAEGRPWMDRFACTQGKVLYINLELDRASCLHRIRDVYTALNWRPTALRNLDVWNLRGACCPMDKLTPMLIRRARDRGYAAVVLDPIYKVLTGDENSADQMAKFCNQFDRLCRELHCALIYCHHHSKGLQGGKHSMDRASGSGVFARDPDAMLDLIQLDLTDSILDLNEGKAACAVYLRALEAVGKSAAASLDDRESATRMADLCQQNLLREDWEACRQRAAEAKAAARGRTAWRLEGTLREFARFEPVNLWFDYPVHSVDDSGVLADVQPENDFKSFQRKNAQSRWQKGKSKEKAAADRKADRTASLDTAYESAAAFGDKVTIYALAEYMGISERTVQRRLKEANSGYVLDGINVTRTR